MNTTDQVQMLEEIKESVACGVTAAFAHMTNDQVKELVLLPYYELQQEARPA